ncbi:hypothetical protein LOTGIDRAFT_168115 [Lottia gigantea]|uniref:L-type lectin-like domain-containing protein n=1 Tax=Lottia gigantea TaxID=225164 RepID=V3ZRA6_LOTGI|nr:hypothetical protein LOTGIDRAFT_168115 [Lottia gigantea]ESO85090.1 hypothetical protein LOTGIDRAFT_168115 [Lottia gigantea]
MDSYRMYFVIFASLSLYIVKCEIPKAKFEYKLSFKGPHLVQRDKSVPFWTYGGDAFPSDDSMRITPSLRSKKGWIWTKNMINSENWQIDVTIRVSGRGRVGADGMQNNPYVMAVVNDGTKQFDHHNDGFNQQLGGCLRDFRNKPYPVKIRVEYYQKALTVYYHNGMTQNQNEFELCLRAVDVTLPKMGFFGVSAATGGLADDHDVISFLTHSLLSPSATQGQAVSEDEKVKFEKEFDDYYKELEKAKQDYKKQHPDKVDEYGEDNFFESQNERELKMIFEGQSNIHLTMKDLNRKLDELLGRQELVLSRVSGGQPVPVQGQGQQGQQPLMIDTIKRHEVNQVLTNQNDVLVQLREMRGLVNDIQIKASTMQGGGASGGQAAMGNQMAFHELKDNLQGVRKDVTNLLNRPQGGSLSGCPPPMCPNINCLSPMIFFIAIGAQLIFMLGYMVYRQNKEAQAKKFY